MAMKRTGTPWMKADDFGRSLPRGIGLNLLVSEIAPMESFCRNVLGANTVYSDEDFGVIEILGSVFMLHADHSYSDNPMSGVIAGAETRGAGIEIRIYGANPDGIEARARDEGPYRSCRLGRQAARIARVPYRRPGRLRIRSKPGDRRLKAGRRMAATRHTGTFSQHFLLQTVF
jgi:hypothetical protein